MKKLHSLAAACATIMALSTLSTASAAPRHGVETAAQVAVSPAQAISAAQKQVGGQATELHLKGKYGTPVYEVEVRSGQREHTVYVDAVSGKVVGSKVETEWKPVRQTAVSLERAMQIAQGKINGRVLEAERDSKRGQIVYKVEILSADNVPYKVIIDADNGNVLASFVDYDD